MDKEDTHGQLKSWSAEQGHGIYGYSKMGQGLEESGEEFRKKPEHPGEWSWELDREGMFIYSSPAVKDITGYRPEDIIGKKYFHELLWQAEKERKKEETIQIVGRKEPFSGLMGIIMDREGREVRISTSGVPVFDGMGEVDGYRGVSKDITEKAMIEYELLAGSEKHLRSLAGEAADFAVYRLISDDESPYGLKVAFASPSLANITGIADPMDMSSWFETIHPDDEKRLHEAHVKGKQTGRFDETLRIFHRGKKEWRWIHVASTGVKDRCGMLICANGIVIDITREKRAENELRERQQELSARTRSLEAVNTALEVLLKKRDGDRAEIEDKVNANIKQLVHPYLEKLKKSGLSKRQRRLVEILEANLNEITAHFTRTMSMPHFNLTSSELQVANLIRHGKTTKEIAGFLNISPRTVSFHRENIRKKIGIKNHKTNLRARLRLFD